MYPTLIGLTRTIDMKFGVSSLGNSYWAHACGGLDSGSGVAAHWSGDVPYAFLCIRL